MDFGMPALIELLSIEENSALARQMKLQFIELNMNLPYCTLASLSHQNLRRLKDQSGIYFTLHADENLSFCDFNERIADAYLDTMVESIDLCRAQGIPLINFHMNPGVYFTLPQGKQYLFEEYKEYYLHRIHLFRNACEKAAGDQVALCIENTGLRLGFILEGMEALLSSPAFYLTWDIGHDYSAGNADRPFIFRHLNKLYHMHIHGAKGKQNHLSLAESELNWKETLTTGQPRRAVIEVKTAQFLAQSVDVLSDFLAGI